MSEWKKEGFDIRILDKPVQYANLDRMCLTHPCYFHFNNYQASNFYSLESVFDGGLKFLVLAFPKNKDLSRKSKFDVDSIDDYIAFYKSINGNDYEFNFVEQIEGIKKGFVGVAISDEKGNVLIECYKQPYETNVYKFTSGSCDPVNISSFLFMDYGDLTLADVGKAKPSLRILKDIEQKVDLFFGYFEFIYGKTEHLGECIYFTDHQTDKNFLSSLYSSMDELGNVTKRLNASIIKSCLD
ncbi:hypothetical protein CEE44_04115 [Candidatus Woesearchaeota archaeon B3_Woes]|nr:MAG: hypothetical protein CEE44_04115 [Candidatus Woesearchaeota archaeon B3_Woes]